MVPFDFFRKVFQSTLPVWGATVHDQFGQKHPIPKFQSTLPVWGATTESDADIWDADISIHAPRVGSDPVPRGVGWSGGNFNPRSPCGERPASGKLSIKLLTFQSTLPVWGATCSVLSLFSQEIFQSTLPVWGATGRRPPAGSSVWISIHAPRVGSDVIHGPAVHRLPISIHAPRVGSDGFHSLLFSCSNYFNPRSPCGERLDTWSQLS